MSKSQQQQQLDELHKAGVTFTESIQGLAKQLKARNPTLSQEEALLSAAGIGYVMSMRTAVKLVEARAANLLTQRETTEQINKRVGALVKLEIQQYYGLVDTPEGN